MATRKTADPFGEVTIDEGALWGKQTQRSLRYFNIGEQRFDQVFIDVLVTIKRCCAEVNCARGLLPEPYCKAIFHACDTVLKGGLDDQFPLHVWQTGSGTQTNMNVNEVLASLANRAMPASGASQPVHPNDHVNMSQSSNDVFPTAMHIVVATQVRDRFVPAMDALMMALYKKHVEFSGDYTVGRTHMMDALPISSGAALSAFIQALEVAKQAILQRVDDLHYLAIGGTAVGSGINAPAGFGHEVASALAVHYALPFETRANLYAAVSSEDTLCGFSGSLKQLVTTLNKIANDFRLLGSGPRCGLNEWHLPANEPGSSIMPGKVNPTQCEALSMVCLQVLGNDLTVTLAAAQGQLQLNTYRPVIIHNVLESVNLLTESMRAFTDYCVAGVMLNKQQIDNNMHKNLSLATLLAPELGYESTTQIVQEAYARQCSLAEASAHLGIMEEEAFNTKIADLLTKSCQA